MPSVDTILQQGQVCVAFAREYASDYAREEYDHKLAAADAALVAELEKQLTAKQSAFNASSDASGEVAARVAALKAISEKVWRRLELAESRLDGDGKKLLQPVFKLRRKGRKLGAAKMVKQANGVAAIVAKPKLAAMLEKQGRLSKSLVESLRAAAQALSGDTRARGRKKGARMSAVDAAVSSQDAVERFLTTFKRLSSVVFEEDSGPLDELHTRLRAVTPPVRHRKPKAGAADKKANGAAKGKKAQKSDSAEAASAT